MAAVAGYGIDDGRVPLRVPVLEAVPASGSLRDSVGVVGRIDGEASENESVDRVVGGNKNREMPASELPRGEEGSARDGRDGFDFGCAVEAGRDGSDVLAGADPVVAVDEGGVFLEWRAVGVGDDFSGLVGAR